MVEPPAPGFTGVVWEARPTEQLARELTTGPGPVPMADAAAAWTRLAAEFGAAVPEYDRIVAAIRGHWQSETSDAVLQRISAMREWLAEVATAAARNAEHATRQATSYEIARLAMPHVAEVAALDRAVHAVQALGASLGAPLVGAAAQISADHDAAKADAARIMRTYEAASAPLASHWQQAPPPALATGHALEQEKAVGSAPANKAPAAPELPATPAMPNLPTPDFTALNLPRPLTSTHVQQVATTQTSEFSTIPAESGASQLSTAQPIPAGAGPVGTPQPEEERVAGAAPPATGAELGIDAGVAAAPPVLGGVEAQPPSSADARS
ncbi:MAG: PPE domain-containing protein [Nocardia sp.]|nr:PPE domain-containing protein [Nocardia sp.]